MGVDAEAIFSREALCVTKDIEDDTRGLAQCKMAVLGDRAREDHANDGLPVLLPGGQFLDSERLRFQGLLRDWRGSGYRLLRLLWLSSRFRGAWRLGSRFAAVEITSRHPCTQSRG